MEIQIPTSDGQVVVISRSELPESEDLLDILQDENASQELYRQFAIAYYQQGDADTCRKLLKSEGVLLIALLLKSLDSESIQQVTRLLNTVQASAVSEFLKGLLLVLTGQHMKAQQQIKIALDAVLSQKNDRLLVAALSAKAMVQFWCGERSTAVKTLRDIWQQHRTFAVQMLQGDVRLALAQVYYAGGQLQKAQDVAAIVNAEKQTVACHYVSAVMQFNQAKESMDAQLIKEAASHAKKAQGLATQDKELTNPRVMLLLSEILFNKQQYEKSKLLAQKALDKLKLTKANTQIGSCANYYIARVCHVEKKYGDAYSYYMKSVELFADLSLGVQYGLAQLCYQRKQYKECIGYLNKILKDGADVETYYDVYKLLASAKSHYPNHVKDSIALHKKLVAVKVEFSVVVKLAVQLEASNIVESLEYYIQALQLLVDNKDQDSLEKVLLLLNNIAALHHYNGEYAEALKYAHQAMDTFRILTEACSGNLPNTVNQSFITILYNMARVLEDQQEPEQAKEIYERIIAKQPKYMDALLRLGCISQLKLEFSEAAKYYKEAYAIACDTTRSDPDSITVCLLLLGLLDQTASKSTGLTKSAKANIDKILKKLSRNDSYAMLLMGNDRLASARHVNPDPKAKDDVKQSMKQEAYKDAQKWFQKTLREDNRNLWAAQGLAIVQAETGLSQESTTSFTIIYDAFRQKNHLYGVPGQLNAYDYVVINTAHAFVNGEKFVEAAHLYEDVAKHHQGEVLASLLFFQARAHYIHGRSGSGSPTDMMQCIQVLQTCLEMEDTDTNLSLKFNVALSLQQFASLVCDQASKDRTIDSLEQAEVSITKAKILFGELKDEVSKQQGKVHYGFDSKLAEQRQRHCEHIQNTVTRHLTQFRANAQMQKEAMEELQLQRHQEEQRLLQLQQEAAKQKLEEEARLEKERLDMYKKLEEERNREESPKKPSKKESKRKRTKQAKPVEEVIEPEVTNEQATQDALQSESESGTSKKFKAFGKRSELSKATVDSDSDDEVPVIKKVKAVLSDEE